MFYITKTLCVLTALALMESDVEFAMCVPFQKTHGGVIDETENNLTDSTTILLNTTLRQTNTFSLGLITKNVI